MSVVSIIFRLAVPSSYNRRCYNIYPSLLNFFERKIFTKVGIVPWIGPIKIAFKWTTTSFDFHQMAVHKRKTMLAHCNLKQNMFLCSKQSSLFSFYAQPSGGKLKDVWAHYNTPLGNSSAKVSTIGRY